MSAADRRQRPRHLLLALGNDILGDDGVAHFAARALSPTVKAGLHIEESSEAGLALLELMEGFDRVLLVDAIKTGTHDPGEIIELTTDDFRTIVAPSPHYAGLPEVLALAECLGVPVPADIRILAMEVEEPYVVREGLTPRVAAALPRLIQRIETILSEWESTSPCTNTH